MSNAASFNLLKFVERRPFLSAGKMISFLILCTMLLLGYFLFQKNQFKVGIEAPSKMESTLNQLTQTLRPFRQQGDNNPMVGVLSSNLLQGEQGFYAEFEALTHIRVKGLWLERVVIQRHPSVIKIIGAMDSPEKLDQLLKQLALQPAFKNIQFLGVDVNKGLLPDVPEKYKKEIEQLKIPEFYRFTLQTSLLKTSGASV